MRDAYGKKSYVIVVTLVNGQIGRGGAPVQRQSCTSWRRDDSPRGCAPTSDRREPPQVEQSEGLAVALPSRPGRPCAPDFLCCFSSPPPVVATHRGSPRR